MKMINYIISLNKSASECLSSIFPHLHFSIFNFFDSSVRSFIEGKGRDFRVLDFGAGRESRYLPDGFSGMFITADIDFSSLSSRKDSSINLNLGASSMNALKDASVDALISKSFIEHIEDTEAFISECSRILKKDGEMFHLFPSRYSSFAVLNRLLPEVLSSKLINTFIIGSKGIHGFKAYYDKCYYSAFVNILEKNGFQITESFLCYNSSDYYRGFFPLYLIISAYDSIISAMGIKDLGAYVYIRAKKIRSGHGVTSGHGVARKRV